MRNGESTANGQRQRCVPSRDPGAPGERNAENGVNQASGPRQRREPFGLNGVASLWVVLGCEFAPLTRGRLWVSPELLELHAVGQFVNYLGHETVECLLAVLSRLQPYSHACPA